MMIFKILFYFSSISFIYCQLLTILTLAYFAELFNKQNSTFHMCSSYPFASTGYSNDISNQQKIIYPSMYYPISFSNTNELDLVEPHQYHHQHSHYQPQYFTSIFTDNTIDNNNMMKSLLSSFSSAIPVFSESRSKSTKEKANKIIKNAIKSWKKKHGDPDVEKVPSLYGKYPVNGYQFLEIPFPHKHPIKGYNFVQALSNSFKIEPISGFLIP